MAIFTPKISFSGSDLSLSPTPDIAQQCANSAKIILRIVARYGMSHFKSTFKFEFLAACSEG